MVFEKNPVSTDFSSLVVSAARRLRIARMVTDIETGTGRIVEARDSRCTARPNGGGHNRRPSRVNDMITEVLS